MCICVDCVAGVGSQGWVLESWPGWQRRTAPHQGPRYTQQPCTHAHQHSTHRTLAFAADTRYFPVANTVSPPMEAVSPSLSSGNPVRGPAVRPLWLAWSRAAPGCHTPFNGDTAQPSPALCTGDQGNCPTVHPASAEQHHLSCSSTHQPRAQAAACYWTCAHSSLWCPSQYRHNAIYRVLQIIW